MSEPTLKQRLIESLGLTESDFTNNMSDLMVRADPRVMPWLKQNYQFWTLVQGFVPRSDFDRQYAKPWRDGYLLIPREYPYRFGVDQPNPDPPLTVEVILSPDLQLEEKRQTAKEKRLEAAKKFTVGQRVKAGPDGKPGILEGISAEGFAGIRWECGSLLSGVEADNLYPA